MRLPLISPSELSAEQKPLYDDMQSTISSHLHGFRTQTEQGALLGPWSAWLHEPVIGSAIWNLVKVVTAQATLPEKVRQVAILKVGSHFKAAYELYAHVGVSKDAGIDKAVVESLAAGKRPVGLGSDGDSAYDVADALTHGGVLPDTIYSNAVKLFGQHGADELIYLVGVYSLVSVTLNGFDIQVPDRNTTDKPVAAPPSATVSEYATVNPTTEEVLKQFPATTDGEVRTALDIAHKQYESWRLVPVTERARVVGKAAIIMRERAEELAGLITLEMGKLIDQSRFEVEVSAGILEYYATHAEKFLGTKPLPEAPGAVIATEPIGVILAIEPWNFPFYQIVRVAGPQIVAGNVTMMKQAPSVPQCALAFAKLFEEAGAPEGVYTNLFCSIDQVNMLIDDFRIRGVTLTGSERAGASVAERAGRNLKKVVLELGGSDPFIVLGDAQLDQAMDQACIGRMTCMGQACVSSKRFIVVGKQRGKRFLEGFVQRMGSVQAGDPANQSTSLGPLISERALKGLLEQIDNAKAHGARIVLGGKRVDRPGWYLEPTIITDIAEDNPLFQEETFGPIASFYIVDSEEEAIRIANATRFGLGASVFGGDVAHAQAVAARIDSGMVWVNSASWTAPELPFGGVKSSGFGRELAELGIGEFVNRKLIRTAS